MKTLCRLFAGVVLATWLAGCSDKKPPTPAAGETKPAETTTTEAKPAETAPQPGGAAPLVQQQQAIAVGQVVDQAAAQTDTKAGRKAQATIDKINAQRTSEE